ncbi:HAMP domain-containing sensor histidine kinase (plasmid) [Aggregatilineales bacterium SYSU G02658]
MQRLRSPMGALLLVLLLSLGGTLFFSMTLLNLSMDSLQLLALVMSGSGMVTTIIGGLLYRFGVFGRLQSIFWTMGAIVIVTVGLILINIWTLSRLVFIGSTYLGVMSNVLVFGGMSALVFGYFVTRSMTDRLAALAQAAEKVAKGDFSTRLAVDGHDEIARLTHSFNLMAADLEVVEDEKHKLEQTRRNLVAWVSHDLRTPLANMRVMMEAMTDGIVTDETMQRQYLANSLNEINNLDQLIDDLFQLARLDVKEFKLEYETIALSELVADVVTTLTPKAQTRQIVIACQLQPEADQVACAPDKIQRVLWNLIDNAIKYTPAGERILIESRLIAEAVQIDITNTGVSIPAEQLSRLFDAFYRGETSRRQMEDGARGAGLGLAIAKGFVEAHGGRIWATSAAHSATFSFTLPLRRALRDTGVRRVLTGLRRISS